METITREYSSEQIAASTESLAEGFKIFTEASNLLQSKYELLSKEAQALRRQLAIKEEEIKRSEGLIMLGKTAASIAHEVRNPLGAIKLFLSLLKQDLQGQTSALELVNEIEKSSVALDNVVTNILHFAKQSQLPLTPTNMHMLIDETILEVKNSRSNNANFKIKLDGNPYINGHESSLKQVLSNLLINALQATADSGEIKVSFLDAENGDAILEISDNGSGIPESVLDTIFDPFVSTKSDGTGLGLAIVKRIVEQHHASISVENCSGACFKIIFPRKNSDKGLDA